MTLVAFFLIRESGRMREWLLALILALLARGITSIESVK